jgi:hypothetical protein
VRDRCTHIRSLVGRIITAGRDGGVVFVDGGQQAGGRDAELAGKFRERRPAMSHGEKPDHQGARREDVRGAAKLKR